VDLPAKTETLFAYYLRAALPSGLTIRPARAGGGPIDGALLLLHAESASIHADLPPSAGAYSLGLALTLTAHAHEGSTDGQLLDHFGALQCALVDLTGAQGYLNAPASGVDPRPVHEFTCHDIEILSHSPGTEGDRTTHSITTRLTLTNADP
jgi:hypothetical protein